MSDAGGTPVLRRAVARAAVAGVCILAPISALRVVLDRSVDNFDDSAWVPLFAVALFAAYAVTGWIAARSAQDAPLTNGAVGAMAALVLWLPIRVVIWLVREDGRGLFTGHDAVFTAGQLFGQLLFAAAFGLFGGWVAARGARMAPRDGEPAGRPRTGFAPSEERPDSTGHGAG